MNKTLRTVLIVTGILVIAFFLSVMITSQLIKDKLENFLETRIPENISQSYEELSLDTFEGTITISKPQVAIRNANDTIVHTYVSLDKLIIEDVSYWDYLFSDKIRFEDIKLKSPKIKYFTDKYRQKPQDSTKKGLIKLYKPVLIDELSIDNAEVTIFEQSKDSILFYAKNATVEIDDILIDRETLLKRIPITFSEYEAEADSLFVKAGNYENVTATDFKLKDKQLKLKNITLLTKYSRQHHASLISKERDHYNLKIAGISVSEVDFGFRERKLFIEADEFVINNPNLNIYRNKLIADDFKQKPLYSQMLRELPINLLIKELKLKQGAIVYTEKVKADNPGGTISFSNLHSTIYNVGNLASIDRTQVDLQAVFLDEAPFSVDWNFDVNNTNDKFIFKANIGALSAEKMNIFTKPNLNVLMEGETEKIYFTIDGSNTTSNVNMRIKYDDFKVTVLNKDGKKKNWLLSTIANVFVSKDSDDASGDFREGSGTVSRDKTKSFFNYLWLNVAEGLKSSMTGSGKD